MNNRKKKGVLFTIIGLALIVAALLLTGRNLFEEYLAGKEAEQILSALQDRIPESVPQNGEEDQDALPDYLINPEMEMPTVEIEGREYIGKLEIPSLELELPVLSQWSYPGLKISPCRYSGSAYTGNFIIAGHNYRTHFGPLRNISPGAEIRFTDVKGRSFVYEVQATETLEPSAVEEMMGEEWDLTLFTCTPGGQARAAVRCLRK